MKLDPQTECEARLFGERLRFIQGSGGYRFAIDALILATEPPRIDPPVLDLGCADGILPVLLWRLFASAPQVGVEIQPHLAERARRNVALHGAEEAIEVIDGDLRDLRALVQPQHFRTAISNPPYYAHNAGRLNPNGERAIAYHELQCTMVDVMRAARVGLRPDGLLWLIYPVERFADLTATARQERFNIEYLRFVHPFAQEPANRFVAMLRLNRRSPPIVAPPLVMYREPGHYSDAVEERIERVAAKLPADGQL
ncbi:MAG: methyltransferase domain-containing protein [Myxococcales bacterium]|nr:methyltransferase domain-containing protein [Myxococcales bacterium]